MFMKLLNDMLCLIVMKDMLCPIMMKCEGTTGMNTEIIHIDLEPLFSDHV